MTKAASIALVLVHALSLTSSVADAFTLPPRQAVNVSGKKKSAVGDGEFDMSILDDVLATAEQAVREADEVLQKSPQRRKISSETSQKDVAGADVVDSGPGGIFQSITNAISRKASKTLEDVGAEFKPDKDGRATEDRAEVTADEMEVTPTETNDIVAQTSMDIPHYIQMKADNEPHKNGVMQKTDGLDAKHEEGASEVLRLKQQLDAKSEECASLKSEVQELNSKLDDMLAKATQSDSRIAELESKLATAKDDAENLYQESQANARKSDSLEQELLVVGNELMATIDELNQFKPDLEKASVREKELEEIIAHMTDARDAENIRDDEWIPMQIEEAERPKITALAWEKAHTENEHASVVGAMKEATKPHENASPIDSSNDALNSPNDRWWLDLH